MKLSEQDERNTCTDEQTNDRIGLSISTSEHTKQQQRDALSILEKKETLLNISIYKLKSSGECL
jgi:hypothetical protein